jgi:DMSO/TMAO reductase YedYZ molybdopterin-dependent catalytic subunit
MRAPIPALVPILALLAAAPALAFAQAPAAAPAAETAAPAPAVLTLHGLDGQSLSLTAAQLAARPHQTVALTHDGKTVVYSGVLLSDILREVDAPMGPRMHGPAVDDVLFVAAADKYRVVLTLAEIDPGMRKDAKVILADQADGKPLDPHEGPFRLVVDGDLKAARSARSVVEIDLKHLP